MNLGLGSAIKMIRTARRMRQRELAERIEVSPNFLSMVEGGKRIPSIEILQRIAKELGMPAGLFLLWQEPNATRLDSVRLRKVRELLTEVQAIYLQELSQE